MTVRGCGVVSNPFDSRSTAHSRRGLPSWISRPAPPTSVPARVHSRTCRPLRTASDSRTWTDGARVESGERRRRRMPAIREHVAGRWDGRVAVGRGPTSHEAARRRASTPARPCVSVDAPDAGVYSASRPAPRTVSTPSIGTVRHCAPLPESQPHASADLIEMPVEATRPVEQRDRAARTAGVAQQAAVDLQQAVGVARGREEAGVDGGDGAACDERCPARSRAPALRSPASADASRTREGSSRSSRSDRGAAGRAGSPGATKARSPSTRNRSTPSPTRSAGPRKDRSRSTAARRRRPGRGENQAAQEDNGQAHGEIIVAESDIDRLIDELHAQHATTTDLTTQLMSAGRPAEAADEERRLDVRATSSTWRTDTSRLEAWLRQVVQRGGSDLLLVVNAPPSARVDKRIVADGRGRAGGSGHRARRARRDAAARPRDLPARRHRRRVVQPGGRRALPRQPASRARPAGGDHPRAAAARAAAVDALAAAAGGAPGATHARPRARRRRDRVGQVDDAGGAGRRTESTRGAPHHHHRGSGRVRARAPALDSSSRWRSASTRRTTRRRCALRCDRCPTC